ncbi:MAG TPA: hypothetical protein VFT16_02505 [Candidatus Saccharimonadales bacterium]|nr:hypothetical protein [Candidatus Saccharimonadales bacterium]
MSTSYELEASFDPEILAPQHEGVYDTQLRAMSELVLTGAGATLGVGTGAGQYYLRMPGNVSKYVSTVIWPGQDQGETNFAVLPPQDFSHRYFGVASPATPNGDKLWVEGVGLLATGSRYGKILINYNTLSEPSSRVPLAIGAFVGNMGQRPEDEINSVAQRGISLSPDTHQRLGRALLSFWATLEMPLRITGEGTGTRAAFDLARQVIDRGVYQANAGGHLDCRYDSLMELRDRRGINSGFVGEDSRTNSLTAVVRNHTTYPERIDYIQIPLSYTGDDAVVSHYAITAHSVGARFCVVPHKKIATTDVAELIMSIQANKRRLDLLDTDGVDDVIRQLYDELGGFVKTLHSPASSGQE